MNRESERVGKNKREERFFAAQTSLRMTMRGKKKASPQRPQRVQSREENTTTGKR
jgi:hypothetical protein